MRYLTILLAITAYIVPVSAQDNPEPLENYNTTPGAAVIELEQRGLLPAGSAFAFVQGGSTLVGGSQFVTFVIEGADPDVAPAPNFVFGGTLQLTRAAADVLEGCALVARADIETDAQETTDEITETATITTFVDVGITSEGEIYILDRAGPGDDDVTLTTYETDVDTTAPVTLTVVMLDDRLTVFADGVFVVGDVEIEAEPGDYAFALNAADPATRCTGDNFWLYTLPADYVGSGCEVTTVSTINQRGGPGTTFDVIRQLDNTETTMATGQAVDSEGFIWWRLEDETWVREDVVTALGYCRTLPEVLF